MKKRLGFVSNSSSSSFVFVGKPKEFEELHYKCIKIEDNNYRDLIIRKLKNNDPKFNIKDDEEIYLTKFLSDSCDYDIFPSDIGAYDYVDGGHGCPYCEEDYTEIEKDIWVLINEELIWRREWDS